MGWIEIDKDWSNNSMGVFLTLIVNHFHPRISNNENPNR